jgi:hypothetical protein
LHASAFANSDTLCIDYRRAMLLQPNLAPKHQYDAGQSEIGLREWTDILHVVHIRKLLPPNEATSDDSGAEVESGTVFVAQIWLEG